MKVPFLNLKVQHETIKDQITEALQEVIEKTSFAGGPQVARFEKNFAEYCHCDHAIGVGSGTDALWMALIGLGIGHGEIGILFHSRCADGRPRVKTERVPAETELNEIDETIKLGIGLISTNAGVGQLGFIKMEDFPVAVGLGARS